MTGTNWKKSKENNWLNIIHYNIGKIIPIFSAASAILFSVCGGINRLVKFIKSVGIERLYGIPKYYFYKKPETSDVLLIILSTLVLFIFPWLIELLLKKDGFSTKESLLFSLLAVIMGSPTLLFVSAYFYGIVESPESGLIAIIIVVFLGLIAFGINFVIFKYYYGKRSDTDEKESKSVGNEVAKNGGEKSLIRLGIILVVLSLVNLYITTLIGYTNTSISNKGNNNGYEIIQNENSEYNVIVGYHNDSAIVMKGEIKKNEDKLIITKGSYKLEKIDNRIIEYHKFKKVE